MCGTQNNLDDRRHLILWFEWYFLLSFFHILYTFQGISAWFEIWNILFAAIYQNSLMYRSCVIYTYIFAYFTATFSFKNEILLISKRLVTFITGETCGMVMLTIYYICLILYIWSTRSTASCKNQYKIIVLLPKYFILMFFVFNEACLMLTYQTLFLAHMKELLRYFGMHWLDFVLARLLNRTPIFHQRHFSLPGHLYSRGVEMKIHGQKVQTNKHKN